MADELPVVEVKMNGILEKFDGESTEAANLVERLYIEDDLIVKRDYVENEVVTQTDFFQNGEVIRTEIPSEGGTN